MFLCSVEGNGNGGSPAVFFSPSAGLFSPGQSRQVSVSCSPDFTHISRDFLGSSLCIGTQSQQPRESEHCFKKVMFPWELTSKPSGEGWEITAGAEPSASHQEAGLDGDWCL